MAKLLYLPEALEDLLGIWRYVYEESRSLEVADQLVESIHQTCEVYAVQPDLGELRPDLAQRLRHFTVGQYVVFYVPTESGIEVVQIIHGARDIPVHFRPKTRPNDP